MRKSSDFKQSLNDKRNPQAKSGPQQLRLSLKSSALIEVFLLTILIDSSLYPYRLVISIYRMLLEILLPDPLELDLRRRWRRSLTMQYRNR